MNKFRILALDGGGIKGLFPAAFLETVEAAIGKRVADHFDLIVGTSTGGIIALGLGLGCSAVELKGFYLTHGPTIFPPPTSRIQRYRQLLSAVFHPRHNPTPLKSALVKTFGQRLLGESRCRLVIPSMNADNGEVHIFKTAHHERFKVDYKCSVVDVAMATAAAPTFFPAHGSQEGLRLLDGGMWANNPVLVGVVEAIYVLGQLPSDVLVLSIGCTAEPVSLAEKTGRDGGLAAWGPVVAEWMMKGQSDSALNMARLILGSEQVIRIQPTVRPGRFCLNDCRGANELTALGVSEARKAIPDVERMFFTCPAEPFIPCNKLNPPVIFAGHELVAQVR